METVKRSRGRPKGSTQGAGLSLEKRLKILSKLATDPHGKPSDVINACKQITELLNDRVREAEAGIPITQIQFQAEAVEEIQIKPSKNLKKIETVIANNTSNKAVEANVVVPQTITEVIDSQQDTLEFNFIIGNDQNG